MIYSSNSPEETAKIASEFAGTLTGGDVICLNGDLGVGKTVFVQALAKALGILYQQSDVYNSKSV